MTDNIFTNWLTDDCFKLDVIEKVYDDYKKSRKEGCVLTKEQAEDALLEYFEGFEFAIAEFLDEEFPTEGGRIMEQESVK